MADEPIKVGGPYVEDENFVPEPTDMVAQFNTEGVGAHGRIEEVSPIFEVDKVKTAQEIQGALDPDNKAVKADRVLLPETVTDNETAKEELLAAADARVEQGVVVGGPTPAEREAALEGDEGVQAAVDTERDNAASNSTGNRDAGEHTDAGGAKVTTPTSTDEASQKTSDESSSDSDEAPAKTTTAKKTTSSKAK